MWWNFLAMLIGAFLGEIIALTLFDSEDLEPLEKKIDKLEKENEELNDFCTDLQRDFLMLSADVSELKDRE